MSDSTEPLAVQFKHDRIVLSLSELSSAVDILEDFVNTLTGEPPPTPSPLKKAGAMPLNEFLDSTPDFVDGLAATIRSIDRRLREMARGEGE